VAFDSGGNLYVADQGSDPLVHIVGRIIKITPTGIQSDFASGLQIPVGLAFDGAGNLFVANFTVLGPPTQGAILKFTPAGVQSTFATGLIGPRGVAVDSAGNLYVSDDGGNAAGSGVILKFGPEGGSPSTFASGLNGPRGLAFDSAGNLLLVDKGTLPLRVNRGDLLKFTPLGERTPIATDLISPIGLVLNVAGNVFVAEGFTDNVVVPGGLNGDILKFSPDETTRNIFASGLDGPAWLAFAPGVEANTPINPSPGTVDIGTVGSATDIALTFPSVTVGGTTTVTPIDPSSAGTLPSGYELSGSNLAFEITTTAIYTTPPPIIVAFQVASSLDVTTLQVFHNEGGALVNVTASNPAPNPATHTIYASVFSLSPFVVAKLATPTNMNQCKNGAWQTRVRANGSRFKNQGDCIQYVNTGK
jgi:hypothetical protein